MHTGSCTRAQPTPLGIHAAARPCLCARKFEQTQGPMVRYTPKQQSTMPLFFFSFYRCLPVLQFHLFSAASLPSLCLVPCVNCVYTSVYPAAPELADGDETAPAPALAGHRKAVRPSRAAHVLREEITSGNSTVTHNYCPALGSDFGVNSSPASVVRPVVVEARWSFSSATEPAGRPALHSLLDFGGGAASCAVAQATARRNGLLSELLCMQKYSST